MDSAKGTRTLRPWQHPGRAELKLVTVAVAIIANTAGAVAALVTLGGAAGGVLILVAVLIAAVGVALEVAEYQRVRPARFPGSDDSIPFMCDAWRRSENTVIVTVDMSPAEHPAVHEVLRTKAAKGQLTLCVPAKSRHNAVIAELEREGAEVRFYRGEPPNVRFSLVHRGLVYEELLLGGFDDRDHWEIQRFRGDDLTRALGHDVAELLLEVSVPRSQVEGAVR
jgi:hypothetical protein